MDKLSISAITLVALLSAGCNSSQMSSKDAIAYQAEQLINTTRFLYTNLPVIPDGDKTELVINAGGPFAKSPDITDFNSPENKREREAMNRLQADFLNKTIRNEFGGTVKILSQNGLIKVVYTNVPNNVDCIGIQNVTCLP